MSLTLRPLTTDDAEQFFAIRFEALAKAPTAFFTTLDEAKRDEERYFETWLDPSREDDVMFGIFDDSALIGITGLTREPRVKRRHIAWIRSVYVKTEYRGRQLGKKLVEHALDHARTMQGVEHVQLSVESNNTHARAIYEALGFVTWGREFPAAKANGVEYGEDYMSLQI